MKRRRTLRKSRVEDNKRDISRVRFDFLSKSCVLVHQRGSPETGRRMREGKSKRGKKTEKKREKET